MGRGLRPIVLGGYVGPAPDAARGPARGRSPGWSAASSRRVARRVRRLRLLRRAAVGDGRDLADAARRRLGRRRARLVHAPARRSPSNGRLVVFTVLIAVFADDTAAYFVGRTIGRHKMAPTISPGQVVGGIRRRHARRDGGRVLRDVRPGLPHRPRGGRARRGDRGRRRRSATCSSRRSSATSASRTPGASSPGTAACSTASIRILWAGPAAFYVVLALT